MAEFTSDVQSLIQSLSFLNFDPHMDLNQITQQNPSGIQTSDLNFQSFVGSPFDNFFTQQVLEFPGNLTENFPGNFHVDEKNVMLDSATGGNDFHQCKKRLAIHEMDSSSGNSSPQTSDNGNTRKNSSGRGKRIRSSDKKEEKPKGVVHVRARRGQATDSHSIAERARRGKINERLKCLQDIVPGCHETMGMAVMLDEIINYVQSLQNQVDFLSMKLTAASTFHDFNSDTDTMETLQRAQAFEAMKMQTVVRRGYDQELASTHLGPLDPTFGIYPPLPYNT